MEASVKITKTVVDGLKAPESGQAFLWDGVLRGFGVRVTAKGIKSFILQYRISGQSRRITLGRYGPLTSEQARKWAVTYLDLVDSGRDPVERRVKKEIGHITLRQVFDAYLEARDLKPLTVRDMGRAFKGISDWMPRPLVRITRDMIERRHRKLGQRSKARANLTMRYLRAIFNFAAGRYTDTNGRPLITDNPVNRLGATRAWYRVDRRQTVIKPHQIKPWMGAVLSLKGDRITSIRSTVSDYLMLVLLTGLRRHEAETLLWDQIDFEGRTLTVKDTKNRQDHTLPLSDYLFDMLARRKAQATNGYVFTASKGQGHLNEPRKAMLWVREKSGVSFTVHDLRRTFATVADSLDIPGYAVKMLLNHNLNGDVTAGYIIRDIERLREPMQKITDYMLEMGGNRD